MTTKLALQVDGMTCAHCARSVERSLTAVDGIAAAQADFASGSVVIEYAGKTPDFATLEPAVRKGGYTLVRQEIAETRDPATRAKAEQRRSFWLLVIGVILVLPVVILHRLHLHGDAAVFVDYLTLGLAVLIQGICGLDFYKGAIAGIRNRNLGMDVLVSIGMASGLIYGSGLVIFGWELPPGIDRHVYFEAATLLVVFLRLGKYVEARARGNALGALRSLLELAPEKAEVRRDGQVISVDASSVRMGEVCLVNAGGRIPVDGEVVTGESDVNEAMLTGEPVPVARSVGDTVRAGTIATNGRLEVRATAVGGATALAHIVRLVEEAQRTKAPIQRFADRVSNVFVPVVVGVALLSMVAWLIGGTGFSRAITHAIAVLVIACPCALGIAVPAAVMIGSGAALKRNILVKNGAALERISKATVFAFDKTGTLTQGKPTVQDIEFTDKLAALAALAVVSGVSTHPFSKAAAEWLAGNAPAAEQASAKASEFAGRGLVVKAAEHTYIFGSAALLAEHSVSIPDSLRVNAMREQGHSVSLLAVDGVCVAAIAFNDSLRDDAAALIKHLQARGARTVLITGDHEAAAKRVADALGIDEVHAGITPEGKLQLIDTLKEGAVVAMVGDGINDAPALARADVGVAIGGGSDVAKETGDMVLMSGRLSDLPVAIDLGRRSLRAIHQNLFLSLCYNVVGIPIAAGALVWAGVFLAPSFAALAMVFSDISVALNSARLAAELKRAKK